MFYKISWFPLEILLKFKWIGEKYAGIPMIFHGFSVNLMKIRVTSQNIMFEKFFPDRFFWLLLLWHKLCFRTLYEVICPSTPWTCKLQLFSPVHFHLPRGHPAEPCGHPQTHPKWIVRHLSFIQHPDFGKILKLHGDRRILVKAYLEILWNSLKINKIC